MEENAEKHRKTPRNKRLKKPDKTTVNPAKTAGTRPAVNRRFCVAPMMDWTDRHCRYFHRLLSRQAVLYTEMVTTGALIHGERQRFLDFDPVEQPVALQLGGSNPEDLARCARMAEEWGYAEVNLNVGCPSDRVQSGMMGACMMGDPALVADCMVAMKEAVSIPVTIKHRIGIDDQDSYDELCRFVEQVVAVGIETFIVHARKAILKGLSPKQNRDIPPLQYGTVYQLKRDFPALEVIINGGIKTYAEIDEHLAHVDGVMLGREAYQNPYLLAEIDQRVYGGTCPVSSRREVLDKLCDYIAIQMHQGAQLNWISRHLLGLYQGVPGARRFRRHISENAFKAGADVEVIRAAAALINPAVEAA
jgi:tRNA-dihydrouridine synthase A